MADKHEEIKWKVIEQWTRENRGRLYCVNQGMATPINGKNPVWFGPLKRKFKGMPDTMGFEYITVQDEIDPWKTKRIPCFCTVEIKTINDTVRPEQNKVMKALQLFGVRCYIAKETEDGGYELKEYE